MVYGNSLNIQGGKNTFLGFEGKKIGVDASNWLSKVWGYFKKQLKKDANYKLSCSKYFHWMLRLFDFYDIKPFFVFDGRKQPLKIKTSKDIPQKEEDQDTTRHRAKTGSDVYPTSLIDEAIEILHRKKIDFIVAPYEADPQLAQLVREEEVQIILTSDSDLVVYGVDIIRDLKPNGYCQYFSLSNLQQSHAVPESLKKFVYMSYQDRIQACILAGCQYAPKIGKISINTVMKGIERNGNIKSYIQRLRRFNKMLPQGEEKNTKAKYLFNYATVYNYTKKKLQSLNLLDIEDEKVEGMQNIVGKPYSEYITLSIFSGETYPVNMKTRRIPKISIVSNWKIDKEELQRLENDYNQKRNEREALQRESVVQENGEQKLQRPITLDDMGPKVVEQQINKDQ